MSNCGGGGQSRNIHNVVNVLVVANAKKTGQTDNLPSKCYFWTFRRQENLFIKMTTL